MLGIGKLLGFTSSAVYSVDILPIIPHLADHPPIIAPVSIPTIPLVSILAASIHPPAFIRRHSSAGIHPASILHLTVPPASIHPVSIAPDRCHRGHSKKRSTEENKIVFVTEKHPFLLLFRFAPFLSLFSTSHTNL